ncbi:MAG: RsbRD N-terminal domain-containing protein, partial [Cyanobacteria bacterium J06632_3]
MNNQKSEILLAKADDIVGAWAEAAVYDVGSSYNATMTYEAIYSRLPQIIVAIAAHLSQPTPTNSKKNLAIEAMTLEPVSLQVELGFDIKEMLRRFRTLRTLVLSAIELNFSEAEKS